MNKFFDNVSIMIMQASSRTEKYVARAMFNNSMTIATAESCTGGLISSRLTDIAGSSVYIKENFVTYSNESKTKILGVKKETLDTYGAVSAECAREMAEGLFKATGSDIVLCTTGIAGPTGATPDKPIGLLYVSIKTAYKTAVERFELNPNLSRKKMKYLFSQKALEFLLEFLKTSYPATISSKI